MNEQNFQTENNVAVTKKKSGLATAGLVLGIIGICISFIPLMFYISFVLGALSIIFGGISIAKKTSKGKAIAALVLGILTVVLSFSMMSAVDKAVDDLSNDLSYMDGSKTDDILEKYLDVEVGSFKVIDKEYYSDTELSVTVKNTAEEKKSYTIEIEAIDSTGKRIATDYIYANDLGSGQSQSFKIFTFVSSDQIESLKSASFRVIEVSMY